MFLDNIFSFLCGYFLKKGLDRVGISLSSLYQRYSWRKANQAWSKYESLLSKIKLVQSGWKDGAFSEDYVCVKLEDSFEIPQDIAIRLREPYRAKWESEHLKNNQQVGVSFIDPHRVSDEIGATSHQLFIRAKTFSYFDFLATNRILFLGLPEEQDFLRQRIGKQDYLHPVREFANPLSVGLSCFCENGCYLVLTHRTELPSSGGHWLPNSIFNAVGEMANSQDARCTDNGHPIISPWNTAKRGLQEEMGWKYLDIVRTSPVLHSFVWDQRDFDYKFFGYVVTSLSQGDIKRRWENAPDHESKSIEFVETRTLSQCRQVIRRILKEKNIWASEAIFCTIHSLLHLRKLRPRDLENLLSSIVALHTEKENK